MKKQTSFARIVATAVVVLFCTGAESAARSPGYLGVVVGPADEGGGLVVLQVAAGGPAAEAGIAPGDLIVAVNRRLTHDEEDLERILRHARPGERVSIRLQQKGQIRKATVTLDKRDEGETTPETPLATPDEHGKPAKTGAFVELLGLRAVRPTDRDLIRFRVPAQYRRGALVAEVRPGSTAGRAKITPGSLIVALDGRGVDSPAELIRRVRQAGSGRVVKLTFARDGRTWETGAELRAASKAGQPRPPGNPTGNSAQEPPAKAEIEMLRRRIEALEHRVQLLETKAGPQEPTPPGQDDEKPPVTRREF